MPKPGVMVHLSPEFNPAILKGIKVYPENPLRFDFILDKGDASLSDLQIKDESTRLIRYFLASLTTPEKDLWVNLSPYEKDHIIPDSFGLTEMGRDLLAEDYMLKQITASLIYPEGKVGKKFWKKIYEEAAQKFHTTNIPINTFNKVWIVPEKAVIYENAETGTAYIVESKLKVMLEQDYLALSRNDKKNENVSATNKLGSQVVREIVIPELTKEVNEGRNFAKLRQVYQSLILAAWYKKKIKDSILNQVYVNQNKIAGVNIDNPLEKQKIYEQYLQAFKKGVYNLIKEDYDPFTQTTIPRKYFSGGVDAALIVPMLEVKDSMNFQGINSANTVIIKSVLNMSGRLVIDKDKAMIEDAEDHKKGLALVPSSAERLLEGMFTTPSQRSQMEVIRALLKSSHDEVRLEAVLGLMDLSPEIARQIFNWALSLRRDRPDIVGEIVKKMANSKDDRVFPQLIQLSTEPPVAPKEEWSRDYWKGSRVSVAAIKSLEKFPAHPDQIRTALEPISEKTDGINFYTRYAAIETLGRLGLVSLEREKLWRAELAKGAWNDTADYTIRIALLNNEIGKSQKDENKIAKDIRDLFISLKKSNSTAADSVYPEITELMKAGLNREIVYSEIMGRLLDRRAAYKHVNYEGMLGVFMWLYESEKETKRLATMVKKRDSLRENALNFLRQERDPNRESDYYNSLEVLTVLKIDDLEAVNIVIETIDRETKEIRESDGFTKVMPVMVMLTVKLLEIMGRKHQVALEKLFYLLETFQADLNDQGLRLVSIRSLGEIYGGSPQFAKRIAPYVSDEGDSVAREAAKVVLKAAKVELGINKLPESTARPLLPESSEQNAIVHAEPGLTVADLNRPTIDKLINERRTEEDSRELVQEFEREGNSLTDLYITPPMHLYGLNVNESANGNPIAKLDALISGLGVTIKHNNGQFLLSEIPTMFGISQDAAQFIVRKIAEDEENIELVNLQPNDQLIRRKGGSQYASALILRGRDNSWTEIPDYLIKGSLDTINNVERNEFADMPEGVWLEENGFRRLGENRYFSGDGYLTVQLDPSLGVRSINAVDFPSPIYFKLPTTLLHYNLESNTTTLMTGGRMVQYYGKNAMFGDKPGSLRLESPEPAKGELQELNDNDIQHLIQTKLITTRELISKIRTTYVVGEVYVIDTSKLLESELEELIDTNIENVFHGIRFNNKNYLFITLGDEESTTIFKSKRMFFQAHDHPGDSEIFPSFPDVMNTARALPDIPTFIIDRKNKRLVQFSRWKPIPFEGMLMVTENEEGAKRYFVNTNEGYPKYILRYPSAIPAIAGIKLDLDIDTIKGFSEVELFDQKSFQLLFPAGVVLDYHKEISLKRVFIEGDTGRPDAALLTNLNSSTKGGIDLTADRTPLQVQNNGSEIKFKLDQAMLQQLQNAPGFLPVIINIQPMTDLRIFLGVKEAAILPPNGT